MSQEINNYQTPGPAATTKWNTITSTSAPETPTLSSANTAAYKLRKLKLSVLLKKTSDYAEKKERLVQKRSDLDPETQSQQREQINSQIELINSYMLAYEQDYDELLEIHEKAKLRQDQLTKLANENINKPENTNEEKRSYYNETICT